MPVFKINVKWGKEKFEGVECNTEDPPLVLKAALFSLSGVQPGRQKLLIKGMTLKDETWGNVKLTQNAQLLMMGSVDELPAVPMQIPVFLEDMNDSQLARALRQPTGLTNLGNTCYLNATLQCLRSAPQLKDAIKKYQPANSDGAQQEKLMVTAIRDLYNSMERDAVSIPPILLLNIFHMAYPRFAEKNDQGQLQQQDANECWTELVLCLKKHVPAYIAAPAFATNAINGNSIASGSSGSAKNFVDQYFGGKFETTMKCCEKEDDVVSTSAEEFIQLSCFIEKEVKYMHSGLKAGLEGEIVKYSAVLGRDARYLKQSRISRLPAYLTIQMVRFFYKSKDAINAKILKDVKFPLSLDVFDLCTTDLQRKLNGARTQFKEEEDKAVERKQTREGDSESAAEGSKVEFKEVPFSFEDDVGSNNSGYYELQAVLTHKGRSSSSGHYVAWTREDKPDEWRMFDDDNVTPVSSEDILKLSGGGDWHCAYVLLYGPRVLQTSDPIVKQTPVVH